MNTANPRRRMFGGAYKCNIPSLYASSVNSMSSAINIYNGCYFNSANLYLFADCSFVSSVQFVWTFKKYTANGTQDGATITGTTTISSTPVQILPHVPQSISTGGYFNISGYCTCDGYYDSDTINYTVYRTKETLEIVESPASGTDKYYYTLVSLSEAHGYYDDCEIYYNLTSGQSQPIDPQVPTTGSTYYNIGQPILLTSRFNKLRVRAFSPNNSYNASTASPGILSYYILSPELYDPRFSVPGGSYTSAQTVIISNSSFYEPGGNLSRVYYTLDGTAPSLSSQSFDTEQISISLYENTTIKAVCMVVYDGNILSQSNVVTEIYNISIEPTLTGYAKNFTGDSVTLVGVVTYNTSDFPQIQQTFPFYFLNTVCGFKVWVGSSNVPEYVYSFNPDLTRWEDAVGGAIVIKFEYNYDGLSPSTQIRYQPIVDIYYRVENTSTPWLPYTYMRHLDGDTYTTTTYYEARGQYSIDSDITCVEPGNNSIHSPSSQKHFKLKALLSAINVSFAATEPDNSYLKHWGGSKFPTSKTYNNPSSGNSVTKNYDPYIEEYLRDPWSFIGSTTVGGRLSYSNTNSSYSYNRDLFGWGTSFNSLSQSHICWQPWSQSTTDSEYNPYGSLTEDLRNVRSEMLQVNPQEPNYWLNEDPTTFKNPQLWGDWASIGIQSIGLISDVYMYSAAPYSAYYSASWKQTTQSNQYNRMQYIPRSFGFLQNRSQEANNYRGHVATPSEHDWNQILFQRNISRRFFKGRISCVDYYKHNTEYINGLFIVSDLYNEEADRGYTPFEIPETYAEGLNNPSSSFSSFTITEQQWGEFYRASGMENYLTFLPAAGYRTGSVVSGENTDGYYWTTTHDPNNQNNAIALHFDDSHVELIGVPRSRGCSVRLLRYVYTQIQ